MDTKEKLNNVLSWLNEEYGQDSEKYSIFEGAKPEVIRFSDDIAVSLWACGAIVCIGSILYFFSEDDDYWYMKDNGSQGCFSIGWSESFINAMKSMKEYVDKNGEPVYYVGTGKICHYELKGE